MQMNRIKNAIKEKENIIIKGNNKEICLELLSYIPNKIKCIYIDPPYNNGETYLHYSDAYNHEQWLINMREILPKLYGLLSDDGSIWISIDDNEVFYLKVLCDELFGKNNFIANIVWQKKTSRENRAVFSNDHEYVLVYAKNAISFKKTRNGITSEKIKERYKNPDNDPRGMWQSITLTAQDGHATKKQYYEIIAPNGKKHSPPNGRCWVYNQKKMDEEILNGNIWFGMDGNGVPRKKKFLSEANTTLTPHTLWMAEEVGTNKSAKKHLLKMFPDEVVFDTPKPEKLLKRIIEISTDENDYVLDAFLGSGTTAAVAHKINRRYIGIDINEICIDYAKKRLCKVINGEQGGISKEVNWQGGRQFVHV